MFLVTCPSWAEPVDSYVAPDVRRSKHPRTHEIGAYKMQQTTECAVDAYLCMAAASNVTVLRVLLSPQGEARE